MSEKKKELMHRCVDEGHANFGYSFWGYVYCGRCNSQIGDKLGGVFMQADKFANPMHKCEICDKIYKKLGKEDKAIFRALRKHENDYDKAINELFGEVKNGQ